MIANSKYSIFNRQFRFIRVRHLYIIKQALPFKEEPESGLPYGLEAGPGDLLFLVIVVWLDAEFFQAILKGGAWKTQQAGCAV